MSSFRGILSWWNEVGLVVSFLLCLGYFGSRGRLGNLPQVSIIAFLAVGIVFCVMLATKAVGVDDTGYAKAGLSKVDSGLLYVGIFTLSVALVVQIGALL